MTPGEVKHFPLTERTAVLVERRGEAGVSAVDLVGPEPAPDRVGQVR